MSSANFIYYQAFQISIEKTKIKKNETGNGPNFKHQLYIVFSNAGFIKRARSSVTRWLDYFSMFDHLQQ